MLVHPELLFIPEVPILVIFVFQERLVVIVILLQFQIHIAIINNKLLIKL